MKVMVVGSLPPPSCARAEALRALVVGLLAEGHSVEVVAMDPVATAHRYIGSSGLAGCLQLARMVPDFDSVVVQVQPGLPVRARAGQLERHLSVLTLAFALRRAREVVIRLERTDDLPGGPGGRACLHLWRAAARIVVGDERERAAFVSAVGIAAESLVVALAHDHALSEADRDDGGWGEGDDVSAENVLELVRRRAAGERRELGSPAAAHFDGWDRLAASASTLIELDPALSQALQAPRRPGDFARAALAVADRRPLLRPGVRAIRLAYGRAKALLQPRPPD